MNQSIYAIVLTCQRYAPLAEHMINCYQRIWPENPFKFVLPDGQPMQDVASRLGSRVILRETAEGDQRGRFRAAVLDMLTGISNEDWVYWCPDDKYPIWINVQVAQSVAAALRGTPSGIAGLCIARRKTGSPPTLDNKMSSIYKIKNTRFRQIHGYKRIWLHQFVRAGVIRHLFERFPEVINSAKEMDRLHRQVELPSGSQRYVVKHNAMVLGESTHRGVITANCAESLRLHQELPDGFRVSDKRIIIGSRPWLSRLHS